MKFSNKEDIEVPIGEVFAMLSNFEVHERSAIRRGIEVQRVDEAAPIAVGLAWDVRYTLRGKKRDVRLTLTGHERPNSMRFVSVSSGLDGILMLELLALSARRTRMSVVLNLAPNTLSARLFLQSLKLAKSNLNKRFKSRVANFVKGLEDRHGRMA